MRTTLLALHGYTMNAVSFRAALSELAPRLEQYVNLVFPDAPHACSEQSVRSFFRGREALRPPPPYRAWWRASDDGRVYHGLETTQAMLRELLDQHAPAAVLGFSQGAMAAAAACAWAARAELPSIAFAVLVAGRKPRARALLPLFDGELATPSLHVWGTSDRMAAPARELSECFAAPARECTTWSGPHRVPTGGVGTDSDEIAAADAIVQFVGRAGHARPPGTVRP